MAHHNVDAPLIYCVRRTSRDGEQARKGDWVSWLQQCDCIYFMQQSGTSEKRMPVINLKVFWLTTEPVLPFVMHFIA